MTKSTIFGKYQGYDIQVGNVYETNIPTTLYPRQAAKELWAIKDVIGFKVNDLNKAGRRFTCEFYDANRKTVLIKRVYREYVESLIDQLGLTPTSTQAESPAVAENVDSQA
jgi:hypothetical protein